MLDLNSIRCVIFLIRSELRDSERSQLLRLVNGWFGRAIRSPLRLCLYIHYFQHFYIFYDYKLSAWSQQRVHPEIGTSPKWQADKLSMEVMLPIHYNLGLRYLDLRYDQEFCVL